MGRNCQRISLPKVSKSFAVHYTRIESKAVKVERILFSFCSLFSSVTASTVKACCNNCFNYFILFYFINNLRISSSMFLLLKNWQNNQNVY